MIQSIVNRWFEVRPNLYKKWLKAMPLNYEGLVTDLVMALNMDILDPERIHEIDDGDYQGTLVYVIGGKGYQPTTYHYVRVYYGSCSGCDTLESIRSYQYNHQTREEAVEDLLKLALHVVQGLKNMEGDIV